MTRHNVRRRVWGVGRWRTEWSLPAPAPVDWRADAAVPMAARCPVLTRRCDARGSVRSIAMWGRCRSRFLPPPTRHVPIAITVAHALASPASSIRTGPTLAFLPPWFIW